MTQAIDQQVHMRWVQVPASNGRPAIWALLVTGRSFDIGPTGQGTKTVHGVILPMAAGLPGAGDLVFDAVRYKPIQNVEPFIVLELRTGMAYIRLCDPQASAGRDAMQPGEFARALAQRVGSYEKLDSLVSILTPEDDEDEQQNRFALGLPLDTEADYEKLLGIAQNKLQESRNQDNNRRMFAAMNAEAVTKETTKTYLSELDAAAKMAWHFWPLIITHSTVGGASGTDVFTVALPEQDDKSDAIFVLAKGHRHWVSYHADNDGNVVPRVEQVQGRMQYRRLETSANANSPVGRVASVVAFGDLTRDAQLGVVKTWLEHAQSVLEWADTNNAWPG